MARLETADAELVDRFIDRSTPRTCPRRRQRGNLALATRPAPGALPPRFTPPDSFAAWLR
jgi:hypothetical protein